MTDDERISAKLKALRDKSGLSVREIARRLDVPASPSIDAPGQH